MKNIVQYFRERFPLALAVFLAAGYAAYLVGIWDRIGGQIDNLTITTLLVSVSFLFLLLRQRVLDEFKDYEHDSKNYSHRPLQRGLVTRKQLVAIGIIAFIGEIAAIWLISPMGLLYYIPVLIFSFLMAKEFFVSKWLKKHQTAYFLSHQSVYVLLALWACLTFGVGFSLYAVLASVALICIMTGAEIVRKYEVRKNANGKIVNDTYITMWGALNTRITLEFMVGIPGLFIAIIMHSVIPCAVALVGVIAIEMLSRNQNHVRLMAGLVFLVQAVLVIVL